MSTEKPKKKQTEEENGDPFWSRILIFTIVIVWVALVAGNWLGHYVIKSGILGKKSTAYGSEFRESPNVKTKSWKQPVKILTPTQEPRKEFEKSSLSGSHDDSKKSNSKNGETIEISPSPTSTGLAEKPSPSPSPAKVAVHSPSPTPTEIKSTPTPTPTREAKSTPKPTPPPTPKAKPSNTPTAKPSSTPKAAETPAAKATGNFALQVGNFEKNENAVELVNKLKDKGYSASIVKEGERFKVYAGSYNSKDKASETSGKLKTDGFESFVITE